MLIINKMSYFVYFDNNKQSFKFLKAEEGTTLSFNDNQFCIRKNNHIEQVVINVFMLILTLGFQIITSYVNIISSISEYGKNQIFLHIITKRSLIIFIFSSLLYLKSNILYTI